MEQFCSPGKGRDTMINANHFHSSIFRYTVDLQVHLLHVPVIEKPEKHSPSSIWCRQQVKTLPQSAM